MFPIILNAGDMGGKSFSHCFDSTKEVLVVGDTKGMRLLFPETLCGTPRPSAEARLVDLAQGRFM